MAQYWNSLRTWCATVDLLSCSHFLAWLWRAKLALFVCIFKCFSEFFREFSYMWQSLKYLLRFFLILDLLGSPYFLLSPKKDLYVFKKQIKKKKKLDFPEMTLILPRRLFLSKKTCLCFPNLRSLTFSVISSGSLGTRCLSPLPHGMLLGDRAFCI